MEDLMIGVILALCIIIPCWLALSRRKEVQRQIDGWAELAQRTGLTYLPATAPNKWAAFMNPPSVRGEYRQRYLSMMLITSSDSDRIGSPVYQNTSISVHVQNDTRFTIVIQQRRGRDRLRAVTAVSNGDLEFDSHFRATGSPYEFVQGAVECIARSDPALLTWIMRNVPCIELKDNTLLCSQNGELTDVDLQNALLNLLCDLAQLVEQMGREYANSSKVRN